MITNQMSQARLARISSLMPFDIGIGHSRHSAVQWLRLGESDLLGHTYIPSKSPLPSEFTGPSAAHQKGGGDIMRCKASQVRAQQWA